MLRIIMGIKILLTALFIIITAQSTGIAGQYPIFPDCDINSTYKSFNICDPIEYQFHAVVEGHHNNKNIRYHLIDGPGEIDEKTGLWSWDDYVAQDEYYFGDVVVAASIGNSQQHMTPPEEHCRFMFHIADNPTIFQIGEEKSRRIFHINPDRDTTLNVYVYKTDSCQNESRFQLDSIVPEPMGMVVYDEEQLKISFSPADEEKRFLLYYSVEHLNDRIDQYIILDTRDNPTPVFVKCPDDLIIGSCGYFSVPVVAVDPDYPEQSLEIRYFDINQIGGRTRSDLWVFRPTIEDIGKTYEVEIRASYGDFVTSTDQSCKFNVTVEEFVGNIFISNSYCGDTIVVTDSIFNNYPNYVSLRMMAYDNFSCLSQPVEIYSITPQPRGRIEIRNTEYPNVGFRSDLRYYPHIDDGNNTYNVILFSATNGDTTWCEVSFKADWEKPDYTMFTVRIDSLLGVEDNVYQGQTVDLPIYLDQADTDIGGFDFLIAYDNRGLNFIYAEMGDWLEDCEWEYFTYRYGPDSDCGDRCPSGLLRIIGIAETNNGPDNHPICYNSEILPEELFHLSFIITNDRLFAGEKMDVNFFWIDCGDNYIANKDGDSLFISGSVIDEGIDIYNPAADSGYPTYYGTQDDSCIYQNFRLNKYLKLINGYILIPAADSVDGPQYADVNLNGVAFELSDFIVFANYLVYGSQVFDINLNLQIKQTDVNQDGITESVEDLQYFNNVLLGESFSPYDSSISEYAFFHYDYQLGLIYLEAPTGASIIRIVVEGEVSPIKETEKLSMLYHFDGENTNILLYAMDTSAVYRADLISGLIDKNIITVEAASKEAHPMIEEFAFVVPVDELTPETLPDEFSLNQNFPNPFNSTTMISFDLPRASSVTVDVINLLGQKVYSVNGNYSAGSHVIEWNADDLASGVYYYRIITDSFTDTKKMLLLK